MVNNEKQKTADAHWSLVFCVCVCVCGRVVARAGQIRKWPKALLENFLFKFFSLRVFMVKIISGFDSYARVLVCVEEMFCQTKQNLNKKRFKS